MGVAEVQTPPRLLRRSGGRVIGGVAGGVADHLGVDTFRVRVVFVVLTAMAGAGVLAYGLLWFFCPPGDDVEPPAPGERRQAYGLALIGLVAMMVVGFAASGTPATYLIPLVFVAVGASLVWREFDTSTRVRTHSPVVTWLRLAGGAVLVIGGLVVIVLAGTRNFSSLSTTLLAVATTLIGVVLLTVPLWMRMWRALNEERAARIRNAEREEIASHLHDSVLQTLALIQKQAAKPDEVARLARSQERELRSWLFGDPAQRGGSLSAALRSVGAEVEDHYGIEVEVVTVGDLSPDADTEAHRADKLAAKRWPALIGATREALVNAAKHSGERKVDVYLEVGDDEVEVYVRDRGVGFDPDQVDDDRHGVAGSIVSRIERVGGRVSVVSAPGRGTNVRMTIPRTTVPGGDSGMSEQAGESDHQNGRVS
ncbi:PspC domain-containing protein [Gordonia sp. VNQ95]|jgi:signal transduction histidine kinase/phage shock protein PspC (stress-responsive transcriptional regulator)|uniref:PspC domain-containing protein n=1 Tax=Gordonia TaxID=2053 RepID=UPI0032B4BF4A